MSRGVDAVVIGSGHNGLVAAAYLARAGWEVEVIERNPVAGGAIATEKLTEPGFLHDTFSSWHPLFHLSAAFAELGGELAARGLEYANAEDVVCATVDPEGAAVLAHRDPGKTAAGLSAGDGRAYAEDLESFGAQMDIVGELLGTELHSPQATRQLLRLGRRLGRRGSRAFIARVSGSARGWLTTRFEGPELGRLLGAGVAPERARLTPFFADLINNLYSLSRPLEDRRPRRRAP